MSVEIISQIGVELTIQAKINLSGSMLEVEENILKICNELGGLTTQKALSNFDTDGEPIMIGNKKYTARTKDNQKYQTPYGEVEIKRYVYQDSSGGKIYVPLEQQARIIHGATPRFAKMLSQKYAAMSAQEALDDLATSNGRIISKKYMQNVSESIGKVMQTKINWGYELPVFDAEITSATISRDGAMLPMRDGTWRESMVGAISLYNNSGEREHSIYIAESPEYGKGSFTARLEQEIKKIKKLFPDLLYLGIADGAKDNWSFLEKHTDRQMIDFYHVTEYLAKASYAAYSEKGYKAERIKWLDERCHQLKHCEDAPKNILEELKRLRHKKNLAPEVREDLAATVTYFKNNMHRMNYAKHVGQNLPIGSGVTEAACKTLVKQRLCRSGMRWKEAGIKTILRLREFLQTTGRWEQFWQKINQYGVPCAA